jgi:hypothetical protein
MRLAGNFNPEWGYLAPAPSLLRTIRIALVAGAVGATAGAAVVFSLVEKPAAEESVASRTLVQPVAPVSASSAPVGASAPSAAVNANTSSPVANETSKSSTPPHPASIAALAESPAMTDVPPVQPPVQAGNQPVQAANQIASALNATPAQKRPVKRAHVTPRYDQQRYYDQASRGPVALLPYGARAQGGDYYGQRGEY